MDAMRMLFCFVGGPGHFVPMAPVARAARRAGHTVAVACGPSRVAAVEAAGFAAFGVGAPRGARPRPRRPLLEVDPGRDERDLRERFAGDAARVRAPGVRDLALRWRPDVVIADEADFGSSIAAEVLDLPFATVLVLAAGTLVRPAVVAGTLDVVRAQHGLATDPEVAAPSRYLTLSPFPPSLRDPSSPPPPTTHYFRPVDPRPRNGAPPWPRHLDGVPTVYVTLGTEFNVESGDLFTRVVEGVRGLAVNVLATVGLEIDPIELGPQPPHVHVRSYLDQESLLPYCDLVVFHGGSGTLNGALAHGLAMVVLPMGADQPANAARCEALGVGLALNAVRATPVEVRRAVARVLGNPRYRRAAAGLRAETAALPDPENAVGLLERLARERAPIPGPRSA